MTNKYEIGSTVLGKWSIKRKIGEGSFGTVYEICRSEFGQTYRAALKIISVPQSDAEYRTALDEGMTKTEAHRYFYSVVEEIVREFALMSRLKGTTNVVSCEDYEVIPHDDGVGWDIFIRMELLTPLLEYAYEHPFARRDIIQLGIDICRALELCQKYNIIHRDVKPENTFISKNGDFKLGDFGIARTIERTMSGMSKKGTYNYMAPEVYRGSEYGFSVDTYSLGVVMYRMLNNNRLPFLPQPPTPITYSNRETALAKRMGGEPLPPTVNAGGRLGEIVLKACAFNPKNRYESPLQMRQELESILYDKQDGALIYPSGDKFSIQENQYASQGRNADSSGNLQTQTESEDADETISIFGAKAAHDKSEPDVKAEENTPASEKKTDMLVGDTDNSENGNNIEDLETADDCGTAEETVSVFGAKAVHDKSEPDEVSEEAPPAAKDKVSVPEENTGSYDEEIPVKRKNKLKIASIAAIIAAIVFVIALLVLWPANKPSVNTKESGTASPGTAANSETTETNSAVPVSLRGYEAAGTLERVYRDDGLIDSYVVKYHDETGNLNYEEIYDVLGMLKQHNGYNSDGTLAYCGTFESGYLIREEYYSANGAPEQISVYEYADDGSYSEDTYVYDENGTQTYHDLCTYDASGNILRENVYDVDGTLQNYYIHEYDDAGNNVRTNGYISDDTLETYDLNTYDSNGNCVRREWYYADGTLISYDKYEYDSDGNTVRVENYDSDGTLGSYGVVDETGDMIWYNGDGTLS